MFEKIKQALDPMPDYYNYTKELIELEQRQGFIRKRRI